MSLKSISPQAASELMNQGAVLVDIRAADEHARDAGGKGDKERHVEDEEERRDDGDRQRQSAKGADRVASPIHRPGEMDNSCDEAEEEAAAEAHARQTASAAAPPGDRHPERCKRHERDSAVAVAWKREGEQRPGEKR